MQLNELFDKPNKSWDVVIDNAAHWRGTAQLSNGAELELDCEILEDAPHVWHIVFAVDDAVDLTGDGNQHEVFATVNDMLKQFKEDRKPRQIAMTAKEKNRASLYARMLRRALAGWKIINFPIQGVNERIIAAVEGTEFPVEKLGRGKTGVRLSWSFTPGFNLRDGEPVPNVHLKRSPELEEILKTELVKAKARL